MSRTRVLVALLALLLALPSAALGQGAGDEQYQDPFGDEQAQGNGGGGGNGGGAGNGGGGAQGQAAQDDGLSDDPPVPDDGGDQPPPDPADETDGDAEADEGAAGGDDRTLPNTGSDPRLLAWAGLLFLLFGVGLRLRTVDPDDF